MECTKCSKILDISNFGLKNPSKKIYYLHCNKCREQINRQPFKKEREKQQYEEVKKNNVIYCECGKHFIGFRQYHYIRHINSNSHINYVKSKSH